MTELSLEATSLDARDVMLARIAALVASDAPPISYARNLGAAGELDIDPTRSAAVFAAIDRSSAQPASTTAMVNIAEGAGVRRARRARRRRR